MQVPAVESTRFAAQDFVARGHAAYPGTIGGAARWKWPAVAVSGLAAALLLAAVSISPLLRTTREPATTPAETRGGDVRLIEPSGVRARLVAGAEYMWSVEALDAGDARIVGSSPQRFTIAPER